MRLTDRQAELLFGAGAADESAETRARSSQRLFVRSQDQLAAYREGATGRVLSAWEALQDHGAEKLAEIVEYGSAIICDSPATAGRDIKERREALGLTLKDVAAKAGVAATDILEVEGAKIRVPVQRLERLARVLGLDDRWVSSARAGDATRELAYRLRTIGQQNRSLSSAAVLTFAEAAWVGMVQVRLETWLGIRPRRPRIEPRQVYRDPSYKVYEQGYSLAQETRRILGFGSGALPKTMREICEDVLGIPVVQAELPIGIAGATISGRETRTLVINVNGKNRNAWIRRSTYAHELCHLLWDVQGDLNDLRVDDYDELEASPDDLPDPVEQRANAFSVEFLAPGDAVVEVFYGARGRDADRLRAVLEKFDVSFTAGRYQLWNSLHRPRPLESFTVTETEPSADAQGRESYAADYFPIPTTPMTRRGRFSGVVVLAAKKGVISWDTAAEYLNSTEAELEQAAPSILDLYPLG